MVHSLAFDEGSTLFPPARLGPAGGIQPQRQPTSDGVFLRIDPEIAISLLKITCMRRANRLAPRRRRLGPRHRTMGMLMAAAGTDSRSIFRNNVINQSIMPLSVGGYSSLVGRPKFHSSGVREVSLARKAAPDGRVSHVSSDRIPWNQ